MHIFDLTKLFCDVHDFYKEVNESIKNDGLPIRNSQKPINSRISIPEIMTIVIYFQLSGYRTFKKFYIKEIGRHHKLDFTLVSYNRFIELMPGAFPYLLLFLSEKRLGNCTGISFVDSTPLVVCKGLRRFNHKVFKGIASSGKSSTGWFFGLKLHLVVNDKGEILSFTVTPGNIDDRNQDVMKKVFKNIFGKVIADKGYISKKLFIYLFNKGIQMLTKVKKNMKNKFMPLVDKLLLRKRAIIENVNDALKNTCQIEHSRHRSTRNFMVNLIAGLIAYSYLPKKPSLNLDYRNLPDTI